MNPFTYTPLQRKKQDLPVPPPALEKKKFLPLPNKTLPPVQPKKEPIITSSHFNKPLPAKHLPSKPRQSFQYANPTKTKLAPGQTRIPPPSIAPKKSINILPKVNKPPTPPKENSDKTDNFDKIEDEFKDIGSSFEDLSFPDIPDELENYLTTIEANRSQKVKEEPKEETPKKTITEFPEPSSPTILPKNIPDIRSSVSVHPKMDSISCDKSGIEPYMLLEENAVLKKQLSTLKTKEAEVNFLRNRIKSLEEREVEYKKLIVQKELSLESESKLVNEKATSKVTQLETELKFKNDELRDNELKQELLTTKLESEKRTILGLKKEIENLKKASISKKSFENFPLPFKNDKKDEENSTSSKEIKPSNWRIAHQSTREKKLLPIKRIGPHICVLMDLLGQKKNSHIQRTKSFIGLSQNSISPGLFGSGSISSQSKAKKMNASLSELGSTLFSYSKQLEVCYSQILFEELPCSSLFPILERLCYTKDSLVMEKVLCITLTMIENCEDCCETIIGTEPDTSSIIIPSSCEESQLDKSMDTDSGVVEGSFFQHKDFSSDLILTSNLGKRKRSIAEDDLPPAKRRKVFFHHEAIVRKQTTSMMELLKNHILIDFAQSSQEILAYVIKIFTRIAEKCSLEQLFCHFEFLFSGNYIIRFMSEPSIEIQILTLDLLYQLLRNSNLLELTRISHKSSKSVLDKTVQLLSVKFINVELSQVTAIRRRSVRVLSLLVCLFADSTPGPLHDKAETIINNEQFLSRLVVLLHSEIELTCQGNQPTSESLLLIRESVQLLVLVCVNDFSFHSVRHLFTSAINHLISGTIDPSLQDLSAVAKALMSRCFGN